MKKKILMQAVCIVLALIFTIPTVTMGNEVEPKGDNPDGLIQTDPVDNTYVGRLQASRLISQLQFSDLTPNSPSLEAIIRSGALEIIRPTSGLFRPNSAVTKEEAIQYALRAAGLSQRAMDIAEAQADDLPENIPLNEAWKIGYLELAQVIGLISQADYDSARADIIALYSDAAVDAAELPEVTFRRTAPATREEVAFWVVGALKSAKDDIFNNQAVGLSVQSYTDWNTISTDKASAVETMLRHNIMNGQSATLFAPKSSVTNQQMAQIIRNLDNLLYGFMKLERRVGVVSEILSDQYTETGMASRTESIRVRRADGSIDVLQYSQTVSTSPQENSPLDAVVLRGGYVTGLNSLEQGDQIEYLVEPVTGTIWYAYVSSQVQPQNFRGRLQIIDMEEGTMTFLGDDGVVYTFPMSLGLYGKEGLDGTPFIRFRANILQPAANLPRGSYYDVTLLGNVITAIVYVGDEILVTENRGLVIENDPDFGYLTILDVNRMEQSFTYNYGELVVHRREFFDMRDTIGGLHEMFPSVRGNSREADMADVIPGDIVVFRTDDDDPDRIIEISAVENTTSRYGRVREINDHGGYFDILMEFENGRNAWYTFVDGIMVLENGRPVNPNKIQLGDWIRVIINQAVLAPGVMMESVREIAIDGGGHHINSIITGQLSGYNAAQKTISLQHARELTPSGWSNHSPLASFDIGGPNVRYYHDGKPVNLAYINRYMQRTDAVVYLAVENHYAGERAVIVSIRTGRDELFRAGTVLSSENNTFSLLDINGNIQTDAGSIVIRNGRLVEPGHIYAPDWARVAMNGAATAAVVDIGPAPATSGVQIIRGRVNQVWPFDSYRVESLSIFDGFRWSYAPIAGQFSIDDNTVFIDDNGITNMSNFLGYTDDSVNNKPFTVISYGGRAVRVIDSPFTEAIPQLAGTSGHLTVRGTIYAIDGDTVSLRDMTVFNGRDQWNRVSVNNPTGTVTTFINTIIIDRNEVIPANRLQVGQQIIAFSPEKRDNVSLSAGLNADVYIVLVEN